MSWRKVAGTILFSPILVGLLVYVGLVFVWKLPMICCERWRTVRYLPYAGLAYYGLAIPLVMVGLGLSWWEVLLGAGIFAFGGGWLLPDPFTYAVSPRKRRAVKLAIEYVEAAEGVPVSYAMVDVVGSEVGRTVVAVAIKSSIPPARRFLAVADNTANIEVLDIEYVSTKYGVPVWL